MKKIIIEEENLEVINTAYFEGYPNLFNVLNISNLISVEYGDDCVQFPKLKCFDEFVGWGYGKKSDGIAICLFIHGKSLELSDENLKSFVMILESFFIEILAHCDGFSKREREIRNSASEFLNSLSIEEMNDSLKIKLLINFVENKLEKGQLVKKSVMLTKEQLKKIDKIEGNGFSDKVRFIISSYFIEEEKKKGIKNRKSDGGGGGGLTFFYLLLKL